MKCCTTMFAAAAVVATATLATAVHAGVNDPQVFGAAAQTGLRFNPGPTVITYNNCFVNLPPAATSLKLDQVVVGFRRLANAPAVNVQVFATAMTFNGAAFNIGTQTSLGVVTLPANGAAAVTEMLTFSDLTTTLALELVSNPGLGGFWIAFQTQGPNAADTLNGFRVATAPAIGASINGFGLFNNAGSGIFEAFFGFAPPNNTTNRFFVDVWGSFPGGTQCVGPAPTQAEGEPCGEDLNGGCNMAFPVYSPIASGNVVAGNYWAAGGTRDTDWYEFTLFEDSNITVDLYSDGPGLALLADGICPATVLNVSGFGCPSSFEQLCLPAGTYRIVVVMSVFEGFPCGTGVVNDYTLVFNAAAAKCAPVCGTGDDCCLPQETPGCADAGCCEIVCSFDSFCCVVAWDAACVQMAIDFCGLDCPTVCETSLNDCCLASVDASAGCSDPECCETVCAADPFCCDTEWDQLCADQAVELCAACTPTPCPPIPCNGTDEGEPCGEDLNGGCNMAFPQFGSISCGETICGTAWAAGGTRDTDWYVLELAEETEIEFAMESQLPMIFGIVDTTDCATATAINPFATTELCGSGTLTVTLAAGTHWVFAASTSFNGFPCDADGFSAYVLTANCAGGCVVNPDQSGDGCVNGADISVVLGSWSPIIKVPVGSAGDANCDGFVGGADISVILGAWLTGPTCP